MTASAKEILGQIGLKYSKQRAAIIELLQTSTQPLTAAEITQNLNQAASLPYSAVSACKASAKDKKETVKTKQSRQPAQTVQKIRDKQVYWPSTVYRTLEYLLKTGIISKLDLPGSEQGAFIYTGQMHDQHVAVCISCQKIFPLPDCPLHHSAQNLTAQGFHVTGHRIEIYGHCSACQKKGISDSCPCCGTESTSGKSPKHR